MEWIPAGIVILLGAFLLLLLLPALSSRIVPSPEKRKRWDEAARRLGGRLFVREDRFRLAFEWHGKPVNLRETEKGHRLEIADPGFAPRAVSMDAGVAGGQRRAIRIDGVPESRFVLAEREEDARRVFGPKVIGLVRDPVLSGFQASPEGFECQWKGEKDLLPGALRALQLALEVHNAFAAEAGIEVETVHGVGTGECQVCGSKLEGSIVRCSRCGTPHHQDCWTYTGLCSTFGCGGREAS